MDFIKHKRRTICWINKAQLVYPANSARQQESQSAAEEQGNGNGVIDRTQQSRVPNAVALAVWFASNDKRMGMNKVTIVTAVATCLTLHAASPTVSSAQAPSRATAGHPPRARPRYR